MQDIADKAGGSRVTVSRVLSNHPSVKAETRQKVLYWVKELDYEPNLIAQSLAGNRTNIIGLLVPEIAYSFFSEIIESIENQAFYEGYSSVYISHYNGGQQIAKHFLNMGFQKIGYIGPTKESTSALKYAGFQQYLSANQITLTDVIECPAPENMNASLVYKLVKQYAANAGLHCEAYFANDDITACEAIAAFRELGYAIPQDIAIAGFDNSLLAKETSPKLTALAQPLDEIGKKSVEILLDQINNNAEPCMYELESRVIARESTIRFVPTLQ